MATYKVQAAESNKLRQSLSDLKEACQRIHSPVGVFNRFRTFWFDTSLGTLDQLRVELENQFAGKNFSIPVAKRVSIDSMIILPLITDETARGKLLRLRHLEHALEERDANTSRENSLKQSRFALTSLNDTSTGGDETKFAVFFMPNAWPYEMCLFDFSFLRQFLENNTYVLLWNYRGYGRSGGSPSLQVRES